MAHRKFISDENDPQPVLLDNPEFLRDLVESVLQRVLDTHFTQTMRAAPYQRNEARTGYRNGSYTRTLTTRAGCIELKVPRDRDGLFSPTLFRSFERHERAFQLTLAEMVLKGVSTRKVSDVVQTLVGETISKSAVSDLTIEIMEEVAEWAQRPLPESIPVLMLDATYVKVRENGRVVSRAVLIALGIHLDGRREILGVEISEKESESLWTDFIERLCLRGLRKVNWVVSDQHQGLVKSISKCFQGSTWQRCRVHLMRNFISRLSKKDASIWVSRLKDIFAAPDRNQAKSRLQELLSIMRKAGKDDVADWLEENIEDSLNVLDLPVSLRARCGSTNVLERVNGELKRRTRVARIYPNREALFRVIACLCQDISEKWEDRVYLSATDLVTTLAKVA